MSIVQSPQGHSPPILSASIPLYELFLLKYKYVLNSDIKRKKEQKKTPPPSPIPDCTLPSSFCSASLIFTHRLLQSFLHSLTLLPHSPQVSALTIPAAAAQLVTILTNKCKGSSSGPGLPNLQLQMTNVFFPFGTFSALLSLPSPCLIGPLWFPLPDHLPLPVI